METLWSESFIERFPKRQVAARRGADTQHWVAQRAGLFILTVEVLDDALQLGKLVVRQLERDLDLLRQLELFC